MSNCVVCNMPLNGKRHVCPAHIEGAINAAHRAADDDQPPRYFPNEAARLHEGLDALDRMSNDGWLGHGYNNA